MVAYVVAGLGNPGSRYAGTRHNIGFDIIDRIAETSGAGPFRPEADAACARITVSGTAALLAKPQTFMNASGRAVRQLADAYQVEPAGILVVADDVNLPLGTLRLRARGSSGGHNGLASVIGELGTEAFPRLRVGVGSVPPQAGADLVPFVLGRFAAAELKTVAAVVGRAAEAVSAFIERGIEFAMNEYNNNNNFLPQNS